MLCHGVGSRRFRIGRGPMAVSFKYFSGALSIARALLFGTDVSPERLKARLAICRVCDYSERKGSIMKCSVCGCALRENGSLINLARYETTSSYGCHHPDGDQWVAGGADPKKD